MKGIVALAALAALAAVSAALLFGAPAATAKAPGPTAGTMIVGGLINPRGMAMGPDGMLYVAEAGTGGSMTVTVGGEESQSGLTGRISKIDPATGARTTVVDNLPSNGTAEEGSVGPAAVAFVGGQLYYVQTHGGAAYGFPDTPTGVYRVDADGSTHLLADIGAFNIANPVEVVANRSQADIEAGGNPYSMVERNGILYLADGNQNQVLSVTMDGQIHRVVDFRMHIVTTGISYDINGPFFVATLGTFPFAPEDGRVYSVSYPGGTMNEVARGASALTDVAVSPAGQLYALQFAEQSTAPGPPFTPFSGKVLRVNSDGTFTPIVTGFTFTTSMLFSGDTLFVANNGISPLGPGEIWEIKNFSSIMPAAPTVAPAVPAAPTEAAPAAPTGVITPPNTGMGTANAADTSAWWLLAAVLGGLGLAAIAAGRRLQKR